MNPQSPKVLESNLKLDSKNTRESKKIQRVKNTYDSTNSQKSKESSKVKSLIRTIPVSIALASALSSHAVAGWEVNNKNLHGGGIVNNGELGSSGKDVVVSHSGTIDLPGKWADHIYLATGQAGNLTIESSLTLLTYYINKAVIRIGTSASDTGQVGTILNQGTIRHSNQGGVKPMVEVVNNSTYDSIINEGIISSTGHQTLSIWANTQGKLIKNSGTIEGTYNVIHMNDVAKLDQIELDGGLIRATNSGANAINIQGTSNIGTIIMGNTSSIHGNIALIHTSTITNGISFDSSKMTGDITLNNNARVGGDISLDHTSTITGSVNLTATSANNNINIGNIALDNTSTITGNIALTASNNNSSINMGDISLSDSTIGGNISLNTSSASGNQTNSISAGNISLINSTIGGTISLSETGRDYNKSTNTLTSLTLDNSHLGGISLTGNSIITDGIQATNNSEIGSITLKTGTSGTKPTIVNGVSLDNSKVTGTISLANGSSILNGLSLNNQSTIANNISLTEKGSIDSLSLNQGTITGDISLTGNGANVDATSDTDNTRTATIGEITLENSSTITGNINIKGNSADNNAKIGSITLGNNTGIGGSIAVGDSNNNAKGTIDAITLNGNSTIAGGIINNANGNIGTIVSNTGTNINNIITNHGTIGSLKVNNQGTIVYRSDSGIITDTLSVASGATLAIKDSTGNNTGTIELKSDGLTLNGSTLDLDPDSILEGHLKNSGNLGHWTNESNIQGHFINTGTIGILNAGSIQDYLENTGFIQTLKQGKYRNHWRIKHKCN